MFCTGQLVEQNQAYSKRWVDLCFEFFIEMAESKWRGDMIQNVLCYLDDSVAKYSDKIAIREEDKTIRYKELSQKSKAVGTGLCRFDVLNQPVGVYMEKGIDALCAFFGIVSAGGFYCMLNTELPDARLAQIEEVLGAKVIVTTEELKEKAKELFSSCDVCTIEELKTSKPDDLLLKTIRSKTIDTNPLYINFTSGSTGVPKGIVVAHRSVIDFIEHFTSIFGIDETDIIANQAPFDFDVSVKDIYSALKVGATLLVVPRPYFSAPAKLMDYLCDGGVTTMTWAVSALCLITTFHCLEYRTPTTLRRVLFSGEVMPYKSLSKWQQSLPDVMYVNLYGPTEITCNCTYHILEKGRDYSEGIPIGKSFPNEDVFLLDDDNKRITEKYKLGRIIVRGTALALGYYRLAEKNAENFIQNPLNDAYPETVYVTGDLGRYDDNGDLLFCGRRDHQIKYMGHRIELEEVEKAMSKIEGVDRCFCMFEKEKERLKGYYVGTIEKTELYAVMKQSLPVFMIPGYLRKMDDMPLTKNGKIDRQAAVLLAEGRKDK